MNTLAERVGSWLRSRGLPQDLRPADWPHRRAPEIECPLCQIANAKGVRAGARFHHCRALQTRHRLPMGRETTRSNQCARPSTA